MNPIAPFPVLVLRRRDHAEPKDEKGILWVEVVLFELLLRMSRDSNFAQFDAAIDQLASLPRVKRQTRIDGHRFDFTSYEIVRQSLRHS